MHGQGRSEMNGWIRRLRRESVAVCLALLMNAFVHDNATIWKEEDEKNATMLREKVRAKCGRLMQTTMQTSKRAKCNVDL